MVVLLDERAPLAADPWREVGVALDAYSVKGIIDNTKRGSDEVLADGLTRAFADQIGQGRLT